jgi:hypothetical protein
VCVCMYVMWRATYVRVHVCDVESNKFVCAMYVCVYIHMYIHIHVCIHAHIHIRLHGKNHKDKQKRGLEHENQM